ncbi:MAG: hypothetical protein QOJ50_2895 [Cryptosporangiaceae bacterium]|jgi:hypothetical protein|nr:hypothetical protein [Cryptosporangiaceae bacterium]
MSMSDVRTVLVCLPPNTAPSLLPDLAAASLATHGLRTCGTMPHFVPGTRRARKLLNPWRNTTAGGPVALLDLEAMRVHAQAEAATRWLVWHDVVAGTRLAKPYWAYAERHREDPARYPLTRACRDFWTQPRLQAMATYNALPNRVCTLDAAQLEAFQAGQPTYAWLAYLTAVPGDGLATADGAWLTRAEGTLNAQLDYLSAANAHLARLHPQANLVAMAATA